MPVSEALRRRTEDPAFWAALNLTGRSPAGPAQDELHISFPVAGGYGLVLDVDPGGGEQHLGLRGPAATEPVPLAWAAPDRAHPATLRWWELDLCARLIALDDPTLPHPGLVVALLGAFAPATPDDHIATIAAVRAAAYRSLRRQPDAVETDDGPEQTPLPLFDDPAWWRRRPAPSPQVLDEATIAAWTAPAVATTEVRTGPRFPHAGLTDLLRHATDRLGRLRADPGYAAVRPLARRITATGDLTRLPEMVSTLTEAGCDHPTVLDALSEPLVPVEACWMVETLAGAEPGTLLRHHV
ncbi:MAG TPA: hypothetical protein VFH03_20175 [Actinoplanes sp.]|nr:hypothetical protein [Actinoplanes sp.]